MPTLLPMRLPLSTSMAASVCLHSQIRYFAIITSMMIVIK